jgi:hypothetical protein
MLANTKTSASVQVTSETCKMDSLIIQYAYRGYRLAARGETCAQLAIPKRLDPFESTGPLVIFPIIGALIWWFVNIPLGVGIGLLGPVLTIAILLRYLGEKNPAVLLITQADGGVKQVEN